MCGLCSSICFEGKGPVDKVVSKRGQLAQEGRDAGKSLIKSEKRTDPCGTLKWVERNGLQGFEEPRECVIMKEKVEFIEQSKEVGQPSVLLFAYRVVSVIACCVSYGIAI